MSMFSLGISAACEFNLFLSCSILTVNNLFVAFYALLNKLFQVDYSSMLLLWWSYTTRVLLSFVQIQYYYHMCINAPNRNLFYFIFKLNMFQIVLLHEILLSTPRHPFKYPYYNQSQLFMLKFLNRLLTCRSYWRFLFKIQGEKQRSVPVFLEGWKKIQV